MKPRGRAKGAVGASWAIGAALWLGAPAPAAAQVEICRDPATRCAAEMSDACLSRFGAGSVAAAGGGECERQFAGYRDCLAEVAAACSDARASGDSPRATPAPRSGAAVTPLAGHQVLGQRQVGDVTYAVIRAPGPLRWDEALEAAQRTGGTLATIGGAEEQAEIDALLRTSPAAFTRKQILLITAYIGPWIGAFQSGGAAEPAGGWTWVDGTPWRFQNWKAGEPNNLGVNEDYAMIYCRAAPVCGEWNDADSFVLRSATYLIELRR